MTRYFKNFLMRLGLLRPKPKPEHPLAAVLQLAKEGTKYHGGNFPPIPKGIFNNRCP